MRFPDQEKREEVGIFDCEEVSELAFVLFFEQFKHLEACVLLITSHLPLFKHVDHSHGQKQKVRSPDLDLAV